MYRLHKKDPQSRFGSLRRPPKVRPKNLTIGAVQIHLTASGDDRETLSVSLRDCMETLFVVSLGGLYRDIVRCLLRRIV